MGMCLIYTNITDIELTEYNVEAATMNTERPPLELSRERVE